LAEFSPPRLVCGITGTATQTATGIDVANNAYVACVVDERIQLKIIGANLDVDIPIPTGGLAQGDPDFATNVRFDTYMCFTQLDDADLGREIYLVQLVGGHLLPAKNISRNRVDEFAPRVSLASDGTPHVVWAQRVGEQTRVMYWNASLPNQEAVFVALGDYPALDVDEAGLVHFVYSRGNDLWYNNSTGGRFNSERPVTTTPFDPESPASVGVDPQGNILICFESKNSLYYSTKSPGSSFRPPGLVDSGKVVDPKMRVRIQGQVAIVCVKGTDIYLVSGQGAARLNPPQKLDLKEATDGSPGRPKSHPSLETDLSNNIHLSYIQDGKVYYTNNAAAPLAEFSANPTQGEVPLTVHFGDLSNGDIQVWEWDFGDGGKSTLQNPVHTYQKPQTCPGGGGCGYPVKLTVKGPGATESTRLKEDFIFVQSPFNTLRIPDQSVFPGQKEVWFPVIGSHKEEIYGFQLLGTYDPNFLSLRDFQHGGFLFDYSAVDAMNPHPELFVANVCEEGSEETDEKCLRTTATFFEVGCIFDFDPPYDHPTIPAGQNQTLLQLIFDVSAGAPQGAETQVALVNNPDLSRVHFNIFIVQGGFSVYPALTPSTVRIRIVEPPFPRFFLRGDADGNGKLELTDSIRILNFLFLGGAKPPCMDAADFSDSGRVDISQAVGLLNYLYQGGSQPAVPFPTKGLDPSPDTLGDC
jgi:PKD repeat protein